MRLLTLNIRHGGGARQSKLTEFIDAQAADVVVLTEFRTNEPGNAIRTALSQTGLQFQEASSAEPRTNGICIAARFPFVKIELSQEPSDESHRVLAVQFDGLSVAGVYFPQGEAKRPVFGRLRDTVLPRFTPRGVIFGDLNTGRPFEDETGDTFYCADCFDDLLAAGLIDSWRVRNRTAKEFTWYSRANNGFRIDHALCTRAFDATVRRVHYVHEPRIQGITDHSALVIESDG